MTIYKKPDLKVFGANAKPTEIAEFEDLLRGWGITIDKTNGIPPMEWFNYLFNRLDGNVNYILQNGITEYDANLEYPQNAVVKSGGKLYLCLRQNTNKPLSNGTYWELLIKNATTSQNGIVQLSNAVDSTDETKASTSLAVKKANDNANTRVRIDGSTPMTGRLRINSADKFNVMLTLHNEADEASDRCDIQYSNEEGVIFNRLTRSSYALTRIPKKVGTLLIDADLSNEINLDDDTKIATSRAVKNANDNTNSRVKIDGSTPMTGGLEIIGANGFSSLYLLSKNGDYLTLEIDKVGTSYLVKKNKQGEQLSYYALPSGRFGSVVVDTSEQLVPAGAIFSYSGEKLPDGYIWADGGYYNPETYPRLFEIYGYFYGRSGNNFAVPNVGERFIRGTGNKYARGQTLEDATRNFEIATPKGKDMGWLGNGEVNSGMRGGLQIEKASGRGSVSGPGSVSVNTFFWNFLASRVLPVADEIRPKSIAFPHIIKY